MQAEFSSKEGGEEAELSDNYVCLSANGTTKLYKLHTCFSPFLKLFSYDPSPLMFGKTMKLSKSSILLDESSIQGYSKHAIIDIIL